MTDEAALLAALRRFATEGAVDPYHPDPVALFEITPEELLPLCLAVLRARSRADKPSDYRRVCRFAFALAEHVFNAASKPPRLGAKRARGRPVDQHTQALVDAQASLKAVGIEPTAAAALVETLLGGYSAFFKRNCEEQRRFAVDRWQTELRRAAAIDAQFRDPDRYHPEFPELQRLTPNQLKARHRRAKRAAHFLHGRAEALRELAARPAQDAEALRSLLQRHDASYLIRL